VVDDIALDPSQSVVAIRGGVGGAKLAPGPQYLLGERLTVSATTSTI
jgi:hypothetical protein